MLETLLPNGRATSQLAFGCAGIGGSSNYADSRKLLLAAWDAGFRHFDVAPSYGLGDAEIYLGRFLKEVGSKNATLTTKAGIRAVGGSSRLARVVKSIARPVLNQIPNLRKKMGRSMRSAAARGLFAPEEVQRSVNSSLKALGVDHIDLFLMHEMQIDDISEELILLLKNNLKAGKIGSFGIGSKREAMTAISLSAAEPFHYLQTNWELHHPILSKPPHVVANCHGALRQQSALEYLLNSEPETLDQLCSATRLDLRDSQARVDLLLAMALADVGRGLVIVQSSKPTRVGSLRADDRHPNIIQIGSLGNEILGRN